MPSSRQFERLPASVVPSHYDLNYTRVDLDLFQFEGVVKITVDVREATDAVKLNALDLWIKKATFTPEGGAAVKAYGTSTEFDLQTATMHFAEPLPVGAGVLEIAFQGELGDNMAGFYRSTYKLNGKDRVMAVTQYEATDARRGLPCWDEPALKATFQVTMTAPADRTVVSNTPVMEARTSGDGQFKTWKFGVTPVMSTYLLAYVVGDFDCVSAFNEDGVQVTVFTPQGKSHQGQFALEVGCKCLAFYAKQFGIAYPLQKYDMLAIPDFAAGAMENYGCVTFRETALLIDENSSSAMRQRVAEVVCHEAAHMWFGNLSTMEWWSGLSLNEGFATFSQYMAAAQFDEFKDIWSETFVTRVMAGAFGLDALAASHPIEVPVEDPASIDEVFDAISYLKGASVIRMLSETIGQDTFMRALNIYLTRHAYSNAVTADLWRACEEACGQPVAPMMDTWWTNQMGFPVLTVGDDGSLSQKRCYANMAEATEGEQYVWHVPLKAVAAGGGGAVQDLGRLTEASATPEGVAALAAAGGWFKLNAGQSGFFRVNYSAAQWAALAAAFDEQSLADKIGLLADAFALGKNGELPVSQALELARAVRSSVDGTYAAWQVVGDNLAELAQLYSQTDFMDDFRRYLCDLYSGALDQLGWEARDGDDHGTAQLRAQVISMLGMGHFPAVLAEAQRRFAAYVADPAGAPLPVDVRATIFGLVVEHGGAEAYETVLGLYRTAELPEVRLQLLAALGKAVDPALQRRTLDFALSAEVRDQDVYLPVGAVAHNLHGGRDVAWQWYQDSWAELVERFADGSFLFGRIAKYTIEMHSSASREREIAAFFEGREKGSATRNIDQALESVRARAARMGRDQEAVHAWLARARQ